MTFHIFDEIYEKNMKVVGNLAVSCGRLFVSVISYESSGKHVSSFFKYEQ